MTELNRHQIRQAAFQSLFGLALNPTADVDTTITQVLVGDPEIAWEDEIPADLTSVVLGVVAKQDELDLMITDHLSSDWTLDRLNTTDLVLMRLALYEAKFTDVPAKIAVNEALQLAHDFTDDKSRKFINGILNKSLTLN
ncbi:transcription antitermination factor NusB [Weissella paramesenteroides]|jgi:N utilization substance protein B|uniref:Transcription antitermination protein NusB n=2 Tax=Weissella paramesenteroides TaxID=1249 RepID=C5R7W5_WEIPA|nr:transcription antitermination factor NusB [Weissella paramesenteroides]ATF41643.1 transcription antitermination factor NusB [Weissella paramesenteroides]EER75753.1 transcription antitermination factor NusB [Weissella paramesenteroides ATCC 33313]KAA8438143.1 transcription antitermination factor NusB [Weissella paramesenteroides]KAA8441261.1 transcription antitermination factor NusB [Weissella paramesenteroides]KAA8441531.1 transcription antitermination factor NusB [Weissella paramesenteroid